MGYMCKSCGEHYSVTECKPTVVGVAYKSRSGCPQQKYSVWVVIFLYAICYYRPIKPFSLEKTDISSLLRSPKMGSTRNKKGGSARSVTVVEFNCEPHMVTYSRLCDNRCSAKLHVLIIQAQETSPGRRARSAGKRRKVALDIAA